MKYLGTLLSIILTNVESKRGPIVETFQTTHKWRRAYSYERSPVNLKHKIISKHDLECQTKWDLSMLVDEKPDWIWDDPAMEMFDSEKFCKFASKKKGFIFVGDSITKIHFHTLIASIGGVCEGQKMCMACGGIPFEWRANAYLDTQDIPFSKCSLDESISPRSTCESFATREILEKYDVIVMNSGAHYREDVEFVPAMENAALMVSNIMNEIHEKPLMIWRNTIPGHGGCNDTMFGEPIGSLSDAEEYVSSYGDLHSWSDFSRQNDLAVPIYIDNGFKLLDAYTPTILREDSHFGGKDCLHYCIPGPSDHWVRLLYSILIESM